MMKRIALPAFVLLTYAATQAPAYVEAPYSLGQVIKESTHIVLVEVTKVNKEKNLIIYKKLADLKGKHPKDEIKHNIGKGGFHPREWQNTMNWAEEGKKAVFFHNGGGSETCIGTYWYQAYPQGEWWGMSHAEPFLLRSYCGDPEKFAEAVTAILAGKEVVVPCMADGNKELFHQRKGKMQLMTASLARGNYNAKRDFVAFGGDGVDIPEFKTTILLPQTTGGWKFLPAKEVNGDGWREPSFDDSKWRTGQTPIGYGEDEIIKRKGTGVAEQGVPFVFRRAVDIPQEVLAQKDVKLNINVASDDSADVWLNGQLVDKDPDADHEFAYWNREIELKPQQFKAGRNVIAVYVRNKQGSSDIYLDLEVVALVPVPKKVAPKPQGNADARVDPAVVKANIAALRADDKAPKGLAVDKVKKTVSIDCAIAPRKLPHLDKIYPIEVVACFPHDGAIKGQKAHETVVTFADLKPSQVHKALEELGLKAGKPARGEVGKSEGPEVKIYLEFPGPDGKPKLLPIEATMIDIKTKKPLPPLKWVFTGSVMKNPDPEKDDKVYGADLSGTLITIFPVTDDTVFQTNLTMKDEGDIKLEMTPNLLPKEKTPAKLIIQVP